MTRTVVVHDYLTQTGGAERVVLAMMRAFPGARLVTSAYDPERAFPEFRQYEVETLWTNTVAPFRRDPRLALPVLAPAFAGHRVEDADVVLCSSSGWAHGVGTDAPKVVYCHNPPRWLYQPEEYNLGEPLSARLGLALLRRPLRAWDRRAAAGVTRYLANSTAVRRRIAEAYGIEAEVLHPPVVIDPDGAQEPVGGLVPGFLLTVSRPRGYKNTSLVCEAVAALPGRQLVVVGGLPARPDGSSWPRHLRGVRGVTDAQLRWLYANCAGLVAVSHEDFGLTPIEANAFGRPVLAWRAGGYLDSVRPGVNGRFVEELSVSALREAIEAFDAEAFDPAMIRSYAKRFSPDAFAARLQEVVASVTSGARTPTTTPVVAPLGDAGER